VKITETTRKHAAELLEMVSTKQASSKR